MLLLRYGAFIGSTMNMMPITNRARSFPKSVGLDIPTPLIRKKMLRKNQVFGLVGLWINQRVYLMEFCRADQ
jgi:hypothetical protein